MLDIFSEISIALIIVLGISFLTRLLKQPLIIGYIVSGVLIGPFLSDMLPDKEIITFFSQLGITFLLFIVGLHLSPRVIKEVGKISLITGIGQVLFTSVIGYFMGLLLGFTPLTSIYIAVALTFSSTIIIMKLLSDKGALEKLYGKISIGFLLVQDLIAIIVLIFVSSFSAGENFAGIALSIFIKGGILLAILFPLSYFFLPKLSLFFARAQELLFIFAIAWGLGLASLFYFIGFSIEVGALIAGIMLSMSPYSYEIGSKLKPLRDFFIISFFILLGSQMVFGNITDLIVPIIVFSIFILIGNPIIVMILMGIFGYSKNTGFMAGLTVAQISEFSLILIALGTRVGHLSEQILPFVTVIGIITIAGSTYLIMYSEKIYSYIYRYLSIFERKKLTEKKVKGREPDCFLFGENRMGFSIMKSFIKLNKKYTIVDFNPERIKALSTKKIPCIYGDISNANFLDELRIDRAKLIVSTIPEKEINMLLLERVKGKEKGPIAILTASQMSDAFELYAGGADYVILPQFLGGKYAARLIEKAKEDRAKYKSEKERQIRELKERLKKSSSYF